MKYSSREDLPLEQLGPFQIIRPLARGGMAEVYLGRKTGEFDGPSLVVLKVWRPPRDSAYREKEEVRELLARLVEEGRLGARLEHDAIVSTYATMRDREHDLYYLVQEYVEGVTLGEVMDHYAGTATPLPYAIVLQLVVPILKGTHYVYHEATREDGHKLRVIHRDIKPDNIMVGFSGTVKLVDFGVARSTSINRPVTSTDLTLGTRHYMAPEQIFEPDTVSHQTDLFSIGLILFELCTLEPVFSRIATLVEYADALNRFDFNQLAHRLDASRYPELRVVLARMLHPNLRQRSNNAMELAAELEALLHRLPSVPPFHEFTHELIRISKHPLLVTPPMHVPSMSASSPRLPMGQARPVPPPFPPSETSSSPSTPDRSPAIAPPGTPVQPLSETMYTRSGASRSRHPALAPMPPPVAGALEERPVMSSGAFGGNATTRKLPAFMRPGHVRTDAPAAPADPVLSGAVLIQPASAPSLPEASNPDDGQLLEKSASPLPRDAARWRRRWVQIVWILLSVIIAILFATIVMVGRR